MTYARRASRASPSRRRREDAGGDAGSDRREEERKDEYHWATGEMLGRLEKCRGTRWAAQHGGSDQAPRMGRRRRRDSSRERVTITRPPVHGSRGASLMLGPLGEPEAITVRRPASPKRNETALLAFVGPYRAGSSWRRPREPSSGIVVRLHDVVYAA